VTRFLITTLAEYQTAFWKEVGLELRRRGREPAFLSFDDRSSEMLQACGLEVFSATASRIPSDAAPSRALEILSSAGIDDPDAWLTHERHAFGLKNTQCMRDKLANAVLAAEEAIGRTGEGGGVVLVQELGGFLSVIGSYFAARAAGVDNWFIEPSFFRGRLLFLRNTFAAASVPPRAAAECPAELSAYLADTIARGAIVIPEKDRHQYRDAWNKVVNLRNLSRLVEKTVDKYWHGKRQEFGYLGHHVAQHAAMVLSSRRLRGHYTALDAAGRFIYFPLHVPGDMALTLRSPDYLDQIGLIDRLCREAPAGVTIAVKEHPAMIGALPAGALLGLARRHDNMAILDPATNNFAVLERAAAVVTVNSKSGAEAGLLGRNVLVLGDAFYADAPFAVRLAPGQTLAEALDGLLGRAPCDAEATRRFFATLWPMTYPGELYVGEAGNVARFTTSLIAATGGVVAGAAEAAA
jgi:hypothetical protein